MESLYQDSNLLINSEGEGFILNHRIVAQTYMKYMHMIRMNIIATQAVRKEKTPLDIGKIFKLFRSDLSNSIIVSTTQFELVMQELVSQGILHHTEKEGCHYFEPTPILNAIHAVDTSLNELDIDELRSHYFLVSSLFSLLLTKDDRLASLMYGTSWNSMHNSNMIELFNGNFIKDAYGKIIISKEIYPHLVAHITHNKEGLLTHINTLLTHLGEANFKCSE